MFESEFWSHCHIYRNTFIKHNKNYKKLLQKLSNLNFYSIHSFNKFFHINLFFNQQTSAIAIITFNNSNRKRDYQRFSKKFRSTAFSINFFFRKKFFKEIAFESFVDFSFALSNVQSMRSLFDIQSTSQTIMNFYDVTFKKSKHQFFDFIIKSNIENNDSKNDET